MQHSQSPESSDDGDSSDEPSMRPGAELKSGMRFVGLGMELAGSTLSLAAIGFLIDSQFGNATPYATAVGSLVGFALGLYRFIRQASEGIG